ncbi:bifunctional DNA primase/polymerase [Brevundimonas olei]|uniref:bifunctional DNA primase/polymerase n=1 Tax=Brevundimonas olei TaxID=657642 RepID=UPI0031D28C15
MTTPFSQAAPDLIALGYSPIPLISPDAPHKGRGKAPGDWRSGAWQGLSRWQRFRDGPPSSFEMNLWLKAPGANVGIVMGTPAGRDDEGEPLFVIGVDFDAADPDALDTLLGSAPFSPMVKRGQKGETRLFRARKTIKTAVYDGPEGRLIDLLAGFDTRQTVVPPSVHPDTGAAYVWTAGPVPAEQLPIFTADDLAVLEEALETCGWERNRTRAATDRPRKPAPAEIDPDDLWSEVKAAAMGNLSAWVPHLDLYGLRKARGGYECVEAWRPSSTGRLLADRKLNLSIQPDGIKDWGSNNTYSSIDLVMAARACDQHEATDWLRERLGLKDEGVVIDLAAMLARSKRSDMGGCDDDLPEPLRVAPKMGELSPIASQKPAVAGFDDGAQLAAPSSTDLPDRLTRVPGLVGQIADFIEDSARRPNRAFAIGAALLIVGTAAGRKIAGPTGSGTHLYVLGLADTGSGKDHALDAIPTIMGAASLQQHVGKGEFMSHQAVYRDLMRQPLTLCPMDEFGSFLKKVNNRNGAGSEKAITGVLRTAWGKSFSTMPSPGWATQGSEPIHSPAFSLFGMATDRDFYTAIDGGDVDNGFLNRFLLIATKKRPETRHPLVSRHQVPDEIIDGLMGIYNVAGPLYSGTMHNGRANEPAVAARFASDAVQRAFEAFENKMIRRAANEPLVARTAEMAIRLATIRAVGILGAQDPIVTLDDLEWGIDFCTWSAERLISDVAEHMAETPLQAESKRIQRLIRARGRIKHRDLLRALGGRLRTREVEDIVKGLKDAEIIAVDKVIPPTGGTPTVWYSITEDEAA